MWRTNAYSVERDSDIFDEDAVRTTNVVYGLTEEFIHKTFCRATFRIYRRNRAVLRSLVLLAPASPPLRGSCLNSGNVCC